jgi:flavin-dependent dehydrogenase
LDQLLEAPGIGETSHFGVRFGSFAPGWRAQLNPLGGDRASLWTFARSVPQEDLEKHARHTRRVFGLEQARILSERRGADPAFVKPGRIAWDGFIACGAAAGQGGLEYGARAGLLAGKTAAQAAREGEVSRHALVPYEKAWKRETAMEHRVLRWGMESLWHLSDGELDTMFESLGGVELGEKDLETLLRADPSVISKVGAGRAAKLLPGLARGWFRAGVGRGRRFLTET